MERDLQNHGYYYLEKRNVQHSSGLEGEYTNLIFRILRGG